MAHMDSEAVYANLTNIFHDVFDDDNIVLSPEMTAEDVPEWDSLSHVRLIIAIQQKFGVNFSAAQASNLRNVGELVELIQSRKP
jgi:acyl carrier protein